MAWIMRAQHKDGSTYYWIIDKRDGRHISLPGGTTRAEAELKLDQYNVRRDLEKEGYDDTFCSISK